LQLYSQKHRLCRASGAGWPALRARTAAPRLDDGRGPAGYGRGGGTPRGGRVGLLPVLDRRPKTRGRSAAGRSLEVEHAAAVDDGRLGDGEVPAGQRAGFCRAGPGNSAGRSAPGAGPGFSKPSRHERTSANCVISPLCRPPPPRRSVSCLGRRNSFGPPVFDSRRPAGRWTRAGPLRVVTCRARGEVGSTFSFLLLRPGVEGCPVRQVLLGWNG